MKELEEATKWIKERIVYIAENCDLTDLDNKKAHNSLETVLNYIENSISKYLVKDKTDELKKEYEEVLEENSTRAFILKCQIKILEELLEGK